MLVEEYPTEGVRRGFQRMSLDVCEGDVAALNLYRSLGFESATLADLQGSGEPIRYLRMVKEAGR